jgi:ketosteroid isomerase-like protein
MQEEFSVPDPVDRVRRFVEAANRVAANRGELDAVPSYFARDSVWDTSRVGIGVFEGVATIRRLLEDWFRSYEELQFVIDELLDVGSGVVLTVIRQMARPVGTTGYIQQREGWVWVWVDGLCASVTVYPEAHIDEARATAKRLAEERG